MIDGTWLTLTHHQCKTNQQFRDMSVFVEKLTVVNYAAEDDITDIQDYANVARDITNRQRIVHISNSHRIRLYNFLKDEIEEHL